MRAKDLAQFSPNGFLGIKQVFILFAYLGFSRIVPLGDDKWTAGIGMGH